jgi:DNA-binding PadR family transcriptional regulator
MSPGRRPPLTVEHALLGFLRQEPMHGYELHQRLLAPEGPGMTWGMKQAHVYALLGRLESEGLIAGGSRPQPARPARRVFRLTPRGRKAFLDWVGSPVAQARGMRQEFLLKLYFARREGLGLTRRLLERQRQACREWLAFQETPAKGKDREDVYAGLVRSFRSRQIQAMLDWINECERVMAPARRGAHPPPA